MASARPSRYVAMKRDGTQAQRVFFTLKAFLMWFMTLLMQLLARASSLSLLSAPPFV